MGLTATAHLFAYSGGDTMGRKSKYDELCLPRLSDIKQWVSAGATDKEVAEALGISYTTLCEYKRRYPVFSDAFTRGRKQVCIEIKAALLKKAIGFEYQEKRQNIRKGDDGESVTFTEITTRYCVPSETAAAMLLRNYDNDWRDGDDISTKFKQQELELKKRIAEANNWLLDEGEK